MKTTVAFLIFSSLVLVSCGSSDEKKEKSGKDEKDSTEVKTDEADMPEVEDVEMEYTYEVTYTKSKKVVTMTQDEYLASGIWENPDVVIKEVPVVKD